MNPIESQVLQFALVGEYPDFAALREQFQAAEVVSREFTGVGFYTEFSIPDHVPKLPDAKWMMITDVHAEMTGMGHGAGFLIYVENGSLTTLEGFCYEEWPADAAITRLYYLKRASVEDRSLIETVERDFEFAVTLRSGNKGNSSRID